MVEPITRLTFDAAELMAAHPPVIHHENKRVVFEIACPPGASVAGQVVYSRWPELPLPERFRRPRAGSVARVPGWYTYEPLPDAAGALEWHVNFADANLFGYYGGGLFAQDEAQVAEHPILASLREALVAKGLPALTEEAGRATPVLVRGAERRVVVATDPDRRAGVEGLYGRRFGMAAPELVVAATRRIDPPTSTNVLAMAAPAYGSGPYTADDVWGILATAYSGFRAAVHESGSGAGASGAVIHTGYWGCGAFGGDRELMSLLQLLAAEAAGVERLVFWTGSAGGEAPFVAAHDVLEELVPHVGIAPDALVDAVVGRGYVWGESNGT